MRRLALGALLLLPVGLGGCVLSVGSTVDLPGERIKQLERRMDKAEKQLGIEKAAQQ